MLSTELSANKRSTDQRTSGRSPFLSEPDLAELAALELAAVDLADLEAEVDEEVVIRADTFVMGEGEDGQSEQHALRKPAPKYMQGLIAGQQVYLISNLSGECSTTLLQPQMVWTLGRNREAGVPIKDRMMSRRHATIIFLREENSFYLLDLNSMNGSYVNGIRVKQRHLLHDGDFLRVGNTEFFFFVSQQRETLEPLHPEVYSKFMNFACQAGGINLEADEEDMSLPNG